MALILNIETSTTLCSVALSNDGELLSCKEINNGYTHTENLHVFINDLLIQEKIIPAQLSAIAVGRGPGSYTGLRIGMSSAKGLAYALNIPLIAVNSLQTMSKTALEKMKGKGLLCPMLDARRMEVYTATFDRELNFIQETTALIITGESVNRFQSDLPYYFFGDGMPKCKSILEKIPNAEFIHEVYPSAMALAQLSYHHFQNSQFEEVAYCEPFYLKDFMIGPK